MVIRPQSSPAEPPPGYNSQGIVLPSRADLYSVSTPPFLASVDNDGDLVMSMSPERRTVISASQNAICSDLEDSDHSEPGPARADADMAPAPFSVALPDPPRSPALRATADGKELVVSAQHSLQAPSSRSNVYECLIHPDEHSVTDDSLLLRTPYIINTEHMVLICTDCKHAVTPDSAPTHAAKFHRPCKIPKDFVNKLSDKYPGLVSEKIHPTDVIRPVFGLAVPVEKYTVCARCRQGYLNVESWRRHDCKKTDVDLHGQPFHFLSLVQTFFRGPRLCYFPIKTPTGDTNEATVNDFTLFEAQFRQVDASEDEVTEPENYRELNQFLSKEGWISHISGCLKSDLTNLTSLPPHDDYLVPLVHQVFLLMSNIQSVIGNAGFHVRRLLGRRPS
jgi:hypothetical protein